MITTEVEVFYAVDKWLNHNIEERSKYAEDLLLKVRFHLLSTETIRHLFNNSKFFKKDGGCLKFFNKVLDCRTKKFDTFLINSHKSRYCNQPYFKLLVCGGYNSETFIACSNVSCIDVNKVRDVETYPPMKTERFSAKVIYLKSDVYAFGGWNDKNFLIKSVEKYSLTHKTWSRVAELNDDRNSYCSCAFMNKIFLIGGFIDGVRTSSCLQFDTSNNVLKIVSRINEARSNAACAVFDERIVVCGGSNENQSRLNAVESYDVLPNKWSIMPNMNSGKNGHSLVVVKNKLFVVSMLENDCEVYDNICKKFITFKSPKFDRFSIIRAYSFENKIFALQDNFSKIFTYDTNKNEWAEKYFDVTRKPRMFSSVKVPSL